MLFLSVSVMMAVFSTFMPHVKEEKLTLSRGIIVYVSSLISFMILSRRNKLAAGEQNTKVSLDQVQPTEQASPTTEAIVKGEMVDIPPGS
jgi:hypothetical protein